MEQAKTGSSDPYYNTFFFSMEGSKRLGALAVGPLLPRRGAGVVLIVERTTDIDMFLVLDYRQTDSGLAQEKSMGRIFNRAELKKLRRVLRQDRSPAEHILWRYLRNRQLLGHKFRRQHSIGRWIVDFYCPELRLVIEVDGDSHYSEAGLVADHERGGWFRQFGIRTIHIRNDFIIGDELFVVEKLKKMITTPTPPHLRRGQ